MNEHFKIVEEVEYRCYELENGQYGSEFVTQSHSDARASYRNGDLVYEYRKVRYSTEWTVVEHTIRYEWHRD